MGAFKSKMFNHPPRPVAGARPPARQPFIPRIYHLIEETRCVQHAPGSARLCSICGRSPRRRMCNDRCEHVFCFVCIEEYLELDNLTIGPTHVCPDDECQTIIHAVRYCHGAQMWMSNN